MRFEVLSAHAAAFASWTPEGECKCSRCGLRSGVSAMSRIENGQASGFMLATVWGPDREALAVMCKPCASALLRKRAVRAEGSV